MIGNAAPWLGILALAAGAACIVAVVFILRRGTAAAIGRRREEAAAEAEAALSLAPRSETAPLSYRGMARPQIEKRLAA